MATNNSLLTLLQSTLTVFMLTYLKLYRKSGDGRIFNALAEVFFLELDHLRDELSEGLGRRRVGLNMLKTIEKA
jgi:hypothetical protein